MSHECISRKFDEFRRGIVAVWDLLRALVEENMKE